LLCPTTWTCALPSLSPDPERRPSCEWGAMDPLWMWDSDPRIIGPSWSNSELA
jgi:hypothetical protein